MTVIDFNIATLSSQDINSLLYHDIPVHQNLISEELFSSVELYQGNNILIRYTLISPGLHKSNLTPHGYVNLLISIHWYTFVQIARKVRVKNRNSIELYRNCLLWDLEVFWFDGLLYAKDKWKNDTLWKNSQQFHCNCSHVRQEYFELVPWIVEPGVWMSRSRPVFLKKY